MELCINKYVLRTGAEKYESQKRGRTIAIISASVILLLVVVYFISHKETDILNVSADEIKSIYVTNGSNGDMVDVPSSVFPDFAKALNEVKLKRGQKMESSGWDYGINLSDGKNDYRLSFVSEENIVIGSKIYGTKEQSGVKLYNSCEHYFKNKK